MKLYQLLLLTALFVALLGVFKHFIYFALVGSCTLEIFAILALRDLLKLEEKEKP